jgi:hypothetical protein
VKGRNRFRYAACELTIGGDMNRASSIKSLHRRFPWVPPLAVLTVAIATFVLIETRLRPALDARDGKGEVASDNQTSDVLMQVLHPHRDISAEVFRVPTTQPEKWDFGGGANTALNWSNWNSSVGEARNLSYKYQNPYAQPSSRSEGHHLETSK